jgi:AcrR family transcriptional regulator
MTVQADAETRQRRRYVSPRRVESATQTREAVLGAARELFAARGFAATGMRDIAQAAGVAVETIYSNFGSKTELLSAAMDVAVVGDTRPVPLRDRPEYAALGRGPLQERAQAAARLLVEIHERTAALGRALREGAATDEELAKRVAELEQRRRVNVTEAVRLVAGRAVSDTAADGVWAVTSMEVYALLIEHAGWSPDRYEQWMAETIANLLRSTRKNSS